MPRLSSLVVAISICFMVSGCTRFGPSFQPTPTGPFEQPEAPPQHIGALSVRISYPPVDGPGADAGELLVVRAREGYSIQSRDSAFVFGSVGRADASIMVNGHAVRVYPTGGWIAWLPLPNDSLARFDVVATAGAETARLVLVAPIAGGGQRHADPVWIDSTSFSPLGDRWLRPGDGIRSSPPTPSGTESDPR